MTDPLERAVEKGRTKRMLDDSYNDGLERAATCVEDHTCDLGVEIGAIGEGLADRIRALRRS